MEWACQLEHYTTMTDPTPLKNPTQAEKRRQLWSEPGAQRCELRGMLKARRDSTLRYLVLWSSERLAMSRKLERWLRLTLKPIGL